MSLLALAAFSGTAEILGTPKPVSFQNGALSIANITLDEARMLLEVLATGDTKSAELWSATHSGMNALLAGAPSASPGTRVAAVPAPSSKSAPAPAAAAEAPKAAAPASAPKTAPDAVAASGNSSTGSNGASAASTAPATPAAADGADKPRRGRPPNTAKATAPASPASVASALEAVEGGATPPATATTAPAADTKTAPATPPSGDLAELTNRLSKMQKLRDIVGEIHSAGYDDAKAILAVCEQLQEHVPVLKRATDLSTRVPKIAASFGINV